MAPHWPLGLNISSNVTIAAVVGQGIVVDWGDMRNVFYLNPLPGVTLLTLSGLTLVGLLTLRFLSLVRQKPLCLKV